jgi:ankyrin repeat protein
MYASQFGNEESVRALIEKGADLEAVDEEGNTALQLASDYGNRKVAKVLCKHGARGALWYAAKNDLRDMVAELISQGHGLEECDKDGNTALQLASYYGNRKVAKLLCKHGARGALCYAAKNDLRDMVAELISNVHDLEECDKDGKTALELAAEAYDGEGHSEVLGLLIKAGIEAAQWEDVNACLGSAGKTLLMYASQCGQEESVRTLIEKGASLEEVDKNGMTALMWASRNGEADTARVLVEYGQGSRAHSHTTLCVSLETVDREGMTALLWASYEGHADTARVLVEKGASLEAVDREEGMTALLWASYEGHADTVGVLVEKGASLEAVDEEGNTALELAAEANDGEGHSEVVGLLIKAGIEAGQWQDVNACLGSAGKTLLMYASQFGNEKSVRALIEKGADLEAVDEEGNTALQLASDYGNRMVAKVLCKHGARGALWYAAKNDLRDMVAELISQGHGLEECDKDGNTALQLASYYGNRKVAKLLCKHGARGALCYAAKNDLRDMVAELISNVHDLEECDKDGKTALELAAEAYDGEGHSEVLGLLIKAGIEAAQWEDVNACLGSAGKTLLMYASQCGQEESVRALIEKGASLEEVDKDGETALMLASRNGHADTVRVLVEHDVSIDAVYRIGKKTALQIAEEEGESAVVSVLKEQYVARGLTVPVHEEREEEEEEERIQFVSSNDDESSIEEEEEEEEGDSQDSTDDLSAYSEDSEGSMQDFLDDSEDSMQDFLDDSGDSEDSMEDFL